MVKPWDDERRDQGKNEDRAVKRLQITPLGVAAYVIAASAIVVDQASKYWILHVFRLPEKQQVPVLPFFDLTMVWNRGVSFGLFRADQDIARWGLAAFSLVVAGAFAWWVRDVKRLLPCLAFGLAIGGAIGNVIDRVRFGAVVDFLDFSGLHFPWVFNVADSAISVGMALVLLDTLVAPKKS
jgi:signal peptidase II